MSDEVLVDDPGPDGPRIDATLTRSVDALKEFLTRPGYAFSNAEVLANLRAVHGFLATVNAAYLGLVGELDTRPEALPGVPPGKTAVTFLRESLRIAGPQAGRDVRAAQAIASAAAELPAMGQALTDGTTSREHLDAAVSTMARIPKTLKTKPIEPPTTEDKEGPVGKDTAGETSGEVRTGAQVIDELFAAQSRQLPPSTVEVLGRQIVARLDPGRAERFDADAYQRRSYSWSRDFAGMGVYRFVVDPATDALLQAAINAWAAPRPTGTALDEHGRTVTTTDDRTPSQRKADAVADLRCPDPSGLGTQ